MEEDYYATSRNGHELKDMYNPEANTICWTVYPEGRYFADEDGFGMENNDEENAYCIINKDLEIIVPFQPMDNVKEMLKKYEK